MLKKTTTVNQIEITADNIIQIRFGLHIVDDDKIIDTKWHRTSFGLDDVDAQMSAVNIHLEAMGREPISADGIKRIKAIVTAVPTANN